MEMPFETGAARYRANGAYIYGRDAKLRFDQRRLASLVGYVAVGLPLVLGAGGAAMSEFRTSMSAYYYEPLLLGDVFVGCLVFIGALLLAYRGWTPEVAQLATLAGVAAFGVALFPHRGWAMPDDVPAGLEAISPYAHYVAATALFLILAFFCLCVFTKIEPHQTESSGGPACAKRRRNLVYRLAGIVILLAMAAIALGTVVFDEWFEANRLVYWLEFLALVAFGTSWMVQGRFSGTMLLDERDRRDVSLAQRKERIAERREAAN